MLPNQLCPDAVGTCCYRLQGACAGVFTLLIELLKLSAACPANAVQSFCLVNPLSHVKWHVADAGLTCGSGAAVYTVQSGDSLSSIATRCSVALSSLETENTQIADPALIVVGEQVSCKLSKHIASCIHWRDISATV